MNGQKNDNGKTDFSLIPPLGEEEFAKVLTFGALKYDRDNWKKVPDADSRYYNALRRHLNSYKSGEHVDKESGLSHLAHAMCCIAFLLEMELEQNAKNPTVERLEKEMEALYESTESDAPYKRALILAKLEEEAKSNGE